MKFKTHPVFLDIKVSDCGSVVKQNNVPLTIKVNRSKGKYPLKIVYLYNSCFSLPKLVLETYKGYPKKGSRMYACCLDGDFKNTHPDNLSWVKAIRTKNPEKFVESHLSASKLTKHQMIMCHSVYRAGAKSLKQLAQKYNTSEMTIHRAVKKVDKYLKLLANA